MTHNRMRWCIGICMSLCMPLIGCYDYVVIPTATEPEALFWELKTNHRAVLLSKTEPYNTLQLIATPVNLDGEPLVLDSRQVSPVIWESSDTTAVKVTQTGVLSAEKVTTRVNVYATMTVGELTRKDTIWVGVTATAPSTLDSLVLYVPTAKNVVAASGSLSLATRVRLANGSIISGVPMSYRVSNRWLADFKGSLGVLSGLVPDDSIYVYATTTVYGVTLRDSVFLYTGLPLRILAKAMFIESQVSNSRELTYFIRVSAPPSSPGSSFQWTNFSGQPPKNANGFPAGGINVDVIFDHPEFAEAYLPLSPLPLFNQAGNILQLPFEGVVVAATRKFTQPGEHWFTVEPLGVRGKITIGER